MPFPNHYRLTFSGILGSDAAPGEIWACNLSISRDPATTVSKTNLQTYADAAFGPISVFVSQQCASSVRLDRVRVAAIDVTGLTERDADGSYLHADAFGPVRAAGSALKAFQTALVVSGQSDYPGPLGRGRFFLPCPQVSPGQDGRLTPANTSTVATAAKTMVEAVNNVFVGITGQRVGVASGGSIPKGIGPAFHEWTEVSVGDVLDTQRRRRNAFVEGRTVLELA